MGGPLFGLVLVALVAWDKFVAVATDYWLVLWIDPTSMVLGRHLPGMSEVGFWIPIYAGGVLVTGAFVYLRSVYFNIAMGSARRASSTRASAPPCSARRWSSSRRRPPAASSTASRPTRSRSTSSSS